MKKLCLITYTRNSEGFTTRLEEIAMSFYNIFKEQFKVIICCEHIFEVDSSPYEIELIEYHGTKYKRLLYVLEHDDSNYYLSIDNDITGNLKMLEKFVIEFINTDKDIAWGRIQANKQPGVISNMVAIDKMVSHNILRPLLWKTGYGISIPGQIFCIKASSFRGKLLNLDTFLDDLALGIFVNTTNKCKYVTDQIIGFEEPNTKLKGLLNQRKRWAIGFGSIVKKIYTNHVYLIRVLIHGFIYHFSWILNWFIIFLFYLIHPGCSLIYFSVISCSISHKNLSMFLYSCLYQIIFPIFHIRWMCQLIIELCKK